MIVPFLDIEFQDLADFSEQSHACFCAVLIVDEMSVAYRLEVHRCGAFSRAIFPVARYDLKMEVISASDKCN
jgi:hypothetical protein